MLDIFDCFGASSVVAEVNDDPSMVMIAGYTPDDLRIKELLLAGERLEAFKYGYQEHIADYDFGADDEVPDDYNGIDEYLDEMEAQDIYNQTMQRVDASMKAREALFSRRLREEQEAKAKAQEEARPPAEPPEPTKEAE